jgi:hypothetical protein
MTVFRQRRSPPLLVFCYRVFLVEHQGVHESSTKALRIMQITTVMVVMFLVWCR